MTIREFVDLFYIKSYLKNQDQAFKNLVKGSVESYDLLTYDDDSYHGILAGNNPHMFAKQVIDAGLTVEKISHHIETLYPIKHNGSVKAKEQYQNKTYQEALFDQIKDKFDGITLENMSDILANALFTIMQDEANEKESATSRPPKKGNSIQEPHNGLEAIPAGIRVSINEKINEILLLIDIMLELGKEITDWQKRHTMSTPFSQCSSWQKLQEKYDRYHYLTIELSTLNRKHHIELLESAIMISKRFSADSFWRCNSIRYCRTWDTLKQIEELSTILSNISNELEKA